MSIKRIVLPIAAAAITCALLAVGLELIATALVYAREGHYIPARQRFASKTNTFVTEVSTGTCGYVDSLYPHPYLGFVHHANPPCGIAVNNIGLYGPDFPSQRPDDRFVILLTGGSVAALFARPWAGHAPYLEQVLNARYRSPTGKPFQVLDGGDGAWKEPQPAILTMLYVDAVHAVVTLDGFNEHYRVVGGERFESPANNFLTVNPLATQRFGDIMTRWTIGRLRSMAADNPIASRSNAAYELIDIVEQWAERRAASGQAPKTSIASLFALPPGWTDEQRRAWQMNQYRKYLRAITLLARDHGTRSAHFIQPVPAIDKPLTPEELKVVGDLSYRDDYLAMAKELLTLRESAVPVVSMLSVFSGDTRTLYEDPIHLRRDEWTGGSPGYERMAVQMAEDLGRLWRLQSREAAAGVH